LQQLGLLHILPRLLFCVCLPGRYPVGPTGPAPLARLLALGRVGDRVVVVVILAIVDRTVARPPSGFKGFLRRVRWNQAFTPADQARPPGFGPSGPR
jgi:hypothetical protein